MTSEAQKRKIVVYDHDRYGLESMRHVLVIAKSDAGQIFCDEAIIADSPDMQRGIRHVPEAPSDFK